MAVFDQARIEARIGDFRTGGCALPFSVTVLDATPSTNSLVKDGLRAGCPEGAVCVAVEQCGGYGRQGRLWASPVGGVYLSLALRPEVPLAQLPTLSLVVSLAVRAALQRLGCVRKVQIKWPNDVVCPEGKLCGISLEALAGGVCVGVGVNALRPAEDVVVGGKNSPTYAFEGLQDCEGAGEGAVEGSVGEEGLSAGQARFLEDIAACVLAELEGRYARWTAEGFAAFCDEYNRLLSLRGAKVEAVSMAGDALVSGMVERADEQGRLLLRQPDGTLFPAQSGEIHLTKVG